MKSLAILQSNYIPWKGYFDIINSVDEFLIYDSMQYTRYDWRNRNKIKTANGTRWLTIPVNARNHFTLKIEDVETADNRWRRQHWQSLVHSYSRAAFFKTYKDVFEHTYLGTSERGLSTINESLIRLVCQILQIKTTIVTMSEPAHRQDKTERIIRLCKERGAGVHLFGPAARNYLDVEKFRDHGLIDTWMSYDGYREYPQLHGTFEHRVSVLDLIFNTGPNAHLYMNSFSLAQAKAAPLAACT